MAPYWLGGDDFFFFLNILVVLHFVSVLIRKPQQADYAFSFLVFYTFFALSAFC